jgi:O-Antigen ligase
LSGPLTSITRRGGGTPSDQDGDFVAPVIPLTAKAAHVRGGLPGRAFAALAVAIVLALSPLFSGYYDPGQWEPLALGAVVLLVMLSWVARPALSRAGLTAAAGLGVLLALSAASILWAESRDSAWTATNQVALYVLVFVIGVIAVRERRSAHAVILILGAPALLTSVVLSISFIFGGGQGAFLTSRLDSPIGYINGTAGLLSMGLWPWLAFAERSGSRWLRAGAIAATSLIAGTVVMTQSRAIIPATVLAAVLVLAAAPNRTRRAVNLLIALASIAVSLHWTLAIYNTHGLVGSNAPPTHASLRSAGLALLIGAIVAGAVWLALRRLLNSLTASNRARTVHATGVALLAATALAVVALIGLGHSTISTQWRAFTNEQLTSSTSTTRFLEAGGFRKDLWRVALDEFKNNPVGGVGAGNYDDDYYRLRRNPEYVVVPHSLELQMAAELGIGGIIGIALLIVGVIVAGFSRRGTLAAEDPVIKVAALGMFAAWLGATSVDWLYDIPGLAGAAVLAAALLCIPAKRTALATAGGTPATAASGSTSTGRRSRGGQLILIACLGALALLAASIGRQYAAGRYLASGTGAIARSPQAALHTLASAESLDPYSLQTLYEISAAYARLDDYDDARDALLQAQSVEPDSYVPPALLGDLAHRRGLYAEAASEYARALSLNPDEPSLQQDVSANRSLAR